MGMTRQAKEEAVADLSDKLSKAKSGLVANFIGLDVASVNEIRRKFREVEVEYKVVKNTLMKRALAGTDREGLQGSFTGPTAIAFKYDDEAGKMGKVAKELTKEFDKFEVKAAFVEGDLIEENVVETMSAIPTLDEARAQLLGLINAPFSKLLATINAPGSQLLSVVQAKADKDNEGGA